MSNNVCIHHTDAERNAWRIGCPICLRNQISAVTADLEFRRELGALQQQEYDKVTAERDGLKKCIADGTQQNFLVRGYEAMGSAVAAECNKLRAELTTAQQEERRLRVLLAAIQQDYNHPWPDEDAGTTSHRTYYLARITEALASTPAPVHPDTQKDIRALSDLLQYCLALFQSIAAEDNSGAFEINHHLRNQLDALCVKIKSET